MAERLASLLQRTVASELPHLRQLTDEQAEHRPAERDWSPKEELGRLIDSAVNNHIRFVLGAIQPSMQGPSYAQNAWVDLLGYSAMPWHEIVDQWHYHNSLLTRVIARIPEAKLETPCSIGAAPAVTLGFLIEDYVLHLQHHVDQLLRRDFVTEYPGRIVGV
jgi:hypothetical protein